MIALLLLLAQTPPPAPVVPAADDAKAIYDQKCKFCHGEDGKAQTPKGKQIKADNFTTARWQARHSDERIKDSITNGRPKTKMKAFKDKLTPEQIDLLVKYVRAFGPKKG